MASTLPDEQLEMQLNSIELLLAMYTEEEISMPDEDKAMLDRLRTHIDDPTSSFSGSSISLRLKVPVEDRVLDLLINYPLASDPSQNHSQEHAPYPRLTLRQPAYLHKNVFDALTSSLPTATEDSIQEAIEHIQLQLPALLASTIPDPMLLPCAQQQQQAPLVRVWFYFQSLSTRAKRQDLVTLAPTYRLTGFVLAGKPGLLCAEGTAADVQSYISDIKRNSWSDIPSFQKKITERFREEADAFLSPGTGAGAEAPAGSGISRRFESMIEITDGIERRGQRGNRGDLGQVEEFLRGLGLGDVFGKVLM